MKKVLLFLLLVSLKTFAQTTTTRKVSKSYYPPLPPQPVIKMVAPKDKTIPTPNTANASFTGISPTASPEVSQANHLQDISVNQYTGTPMVGIPLYSLQEGKLGVSLGLNYNASGIRGHQLSGWTGLGWDLEGIPMITRIVRGLPDEGKFEMTSWTTKVDRQGYSTSLFGLGANDDQEPDYFFLNIGGASYKFIIKNNGEVKFLLDNDITCSIGASPREGSSIVRQFDNFVFTVPDGTKYQFTNSAIEKSAEVEVGFAQTNQVYPETFSSSSNFSHYLKTNSVVSAWYCKQIISPHGQTINFSYKNVRYSYYKLADNEATGNCPSSVDKKVNRVFVEGAVVDKIENQHTVIKFNDGYTYCIELPDPITLVNKEYCYLINIANREDIDDWTQNPSNSSPAKVMKNMVVYDKDHPTEKMTWTFDYGYFTGTDNSGYDLPSGYTYNGTNPVGLTHKKRLKLSTIHYPDGNQSDFKYYGEDTGFNFKTRFTYGIDHWGYINGADGNIGGMGLIGNDFLGSCGANRATDINFLRYGSLEKVTHSAGSTIELSYGTHYAKNYGTTPIGGLRIQELRTKDFLRGTETIKSYDYTTGGQPSGYLFIKPIYRFDDYNATRYTNSALYDLLMSEAGRPSVGYGQVTETVYDVTNAVQVGKTISYFDQDETELSTATPNVPYCYFDINNEQVCINITVYYLDRFIPQYDFRGGSLLKQENYNQANQKLTENSMIYTPNNGLAIDSLYCQRVVKLNGVNQTGYYYLKTKKYRTEQTTSKSFSEDGSGTPQSSTVEFVYKDEMPLEYRNAYKGKHNQLVKSITTDSYGYTVEQLNKYVADFNFDVDSVLTCEPDCFPQNPCPESCQYWRVTVHVPVAGTEASGIYDMLNTMSGYPVETVSKRNNKVISANYQTYSNGHAISSYALRTIPKANFSEVLFQKSTDLMNKDSGYGTARSEVLNYNLYGLPELVEIKRGAKSQIIYDTQNVLPIYKTSNYGIADALSSTYQYTKSFQGISKEISPNNLEVRYNYRSSDSRLDKLTDKDGLILKKYNYDLTGSFTASSITWDNTRRTKLCNGGQITLSVYVNNLVVGAMAQFSTDGGSTWQNANIGSDGYSFTLTPTNTYQTFLARASNNPTTTISTQYHASCTTSPPFDWSNNSCTNVNGTCNFFVSATGLATDSFAEFSIDGTNWYRANVGNNGYNVSVPYVSNSQQYFLTRTAEDHSVFKQGNLAKCQ